MKDEHLIGLGLALWLAKKEHTKRKAERERVAVAPKPQPVPRKLVEPKPVVYAWLYREPSETAITLSVGPDPEHAVVRGKFDQEAVARKAVSDEGLTLAWPNVRDLD